MRVRGLSSLPCESMVGRVVARVVPGPILWRPWFVSLLTTRSSRSRSISRRQKGTLCYVAFSADLGIQGFRQDVIGAGKGTLEDFETIFHTFFKIFSHFFQDFPHFFQDFPHFFQDFPHFFQDFPHTNQDSSHTNQVSSY